MYTPNDMDDKLIFGLHQSDQTAFGIVYERYRREVYRYVYKLLNNKERTNDLVEQIFISVWISRLVIPEKVSLASYLRQVAGKITARYQSREASGTNL